ncbi:PilZ domain-containing protein [uncultured Desulfobacter sp.]|uniref:PilZ domain-containing protein n=1 Tax=uncultured Desulfobacter sp. TaxID=240139 RepID=UPI0029C9A8A2|nr:PilZ domain-containing protein [uncultured Desulfobacter sp.]
MDFDVKKIFFPSVGVDLVFNINTDFPISKSSIIYDADFKKQAITIAQPSIPVTPDTPFEQLHLTTLVYINQRRLRIGVCCRPIQFISNFPMAGGLAVEAIVVHYQLPAIETNIRSAFRLPLTGRYAVKAKIVYNKQEYRTPSDFKIKDLSFSGLSLVILERKKKRTPPLSSLKIGTEMILGLALVDRDQPGAIGTFPIKIQVVRINMNYSETHTLIGLKITSITPKNEEILNRFIHTAQIEELKRISKKG